MRTVAEPRAINVVFRWAIDVSEGEGEVEGEQGGRKVGEFI
jgi:hypothetical protein